MSPLILLIHVVPMQIEDNVTHAISILTNTTRKHCHESALMTAAHILICLTQEGKSIKEIARQDFNDNLELVTVWADYMIGANWMQYRPVNSENKWIATSNGKNWVQRILDKVAVANVDPYYDI